MKIISFDDIKNLNLSPITCYKWGMKRYGRRRMLCSHQKYI